MSNNDDPLGGMPAMVALLAEKLVRVTDRVSNVETGLDAHEHGEEAQAELVAQVAELRASVEQLLAVQKATVWDWSTMEDEEAAEVWKILTDLVRNVLTDQLSVVHWTPEPDKLNKAAAEKLTAFPPCWVQHRDVVWLLTPLCQAWTEIHGPGGRVAAALDWHSRHLPAVITRLSQTSAQRCLRGCAVPTGFGWKLDDPLTRVSKEERDLNRRRLDGTTTR